MGCGSSSSTKSNHHFRSPLYIEEEPEQKADRLNINRLTVPSYISHIKQGNTLCVNDSNILLLQDGPTTLDIRLPPRFDPKKIPWRNGLVRDIVWCSDLSIFLLLTKDALFSFNPDSLVTSPTVTRNSTIDLAIHLYSKIKPYDDDNSFWRCACVGRTLYITYSGYGTAIDEYSLRASSCKLVNRWTSPKTCATHEGIWCIRYHPDTDQLGFAIMDTRNDEWRFEVRDRQKLVPLWQTTLPLLNGDCEISPLPNEEWLAMNSCGIRLVQIANQQLKAAVEYTRELKNAISIGNLYFAIRTKNTLEIHQFKSLK